MSVPTNDRVHLSIGEVLANLRDEFPDATVSKIRFLESQGLIDPERTPSGYRKFYDDDVDRLRWILFQQREYFLPLRVIKERLDRFGPTGAPDVGSGIESGIESTDGASSQTSEPNPLAAMREQQRARRAATTTPQLPFDDLIDDDETAVHELGEVTEHDSEPKTDELTRADLIREGGVTERQLVELESFGLVTPMVGSGEHALYEREALTAARVAAGFHARGIEARHLKMYQHFADRESALFAQVLLPYLRQRNPKARTKLQEELEELARLGRQLRTVMLQAALRDSLSE